jgi:raffinose/stachyose/melibiose transport system permease protein
MGQEETALTTLSMISVWQYIGMPMMLIYAALLAVPEEIVEAAHVEGAGALRIFWQIKLPLIYPTLGLVTILTFVANFNAFDLIYSIKGALAGPNYSTDILGTLFYRTFFGYQAQVGNAYLGSAVATLMFLVILAGVGVYFVGVQRRLTRFAL